MNNANELMKIADIHAARVIHAIDILTPLFPLTSVAVENLSENNFLFIELLTNRFSKLQDFIGTKLIDVFLDVHGELMAQMTMIDKLNKLERLGFLDDANIWLKMREVRNHLSHEYPDHPEITAEYLNQVFVLAPQLIKLLRSIEKKL
jgi:hypothetical protein